MGIRTSASKVAGWWSIQNADNPGLFNEGMGKDTGMYNGDTPADIMASAINDIIASYEEEWHRPPYLEELQASWTFAHNPEWLAEKKGVVQAPSDPPKLDKLHTAAFFTLDELWEAGGGEGPYPYPATETVLKPENFVSAGSYPLSQLLAYLRAAHQAHWTTHWQSKGSAFYGDHLLFERLYNSILPEIDGLAEKLVAKYGPEAVELSSQMTVVAGLAEKWVTEPDLIARAYAIETKLQEVIAVSKEATQGMSLGLDNFLAQLADNHETALYLLGQRSSVKEASHHVALYSPKVQQIRSFAQRYKLDDFIFDDSSLEKNYLDSLEDFLTVFVWVYDEVEKYGPDGPSGHEIAGKLKSNLAAQVISKHKDLDITEISEAFMDDMDPVLLRQGVKALRRILKV